MLFHVFEVLLENDFTSSNGGQWRVKVENRGGEDLSREATVSLFHPKTPLWGIVNPSGKEYN